MRRFLPLLTLLAAGCERMPEDPVFAYGRLLHADGAPHVGAALRVERALYRDGRDFLREPSRDFQPYSEGRSEATGDFTLAFLHGDVLEEDNVNYTYTQYRFRAYPPLEADGSGVFLAFNFRDDVELPPLQPWNPGLTVGDGPEGPRLSFAAAPSAPETPPSAELPWYAEEDGTQYIATPTVPEPVVQLHAEGGLVWQQRGAASPWVPGAYVLEDFPGVEAQVRALTAGTWYFYPLASNSSDLTFRVEWRGPRVPMPGGTLRPVSRGAACSPLPDGGSGPCPYTDGKLAPVETARSEPVPGEPQVLGGVESLTFTLEAPARPRRAVLRGLEAGYTFLPALRVLLEGSADGATWAPLASVPVVRFASEEQRWAFSGYSYEDLEEDSPWDGPLNVFNGALWLDMPLTPGEPVRQVRLRVQADGAQVPTTPQSIWALTELSLFE
jgi:hypothetical protein